MEIMIIGLLVVWIGVSTTIAGQVARNSLSRSANVLLITAIGYVVVVAGLFFSMQSMIPYGASAMSLLTPIALAGAVAAIVVAILSHVRIGQVRRKAASQ